MNIYTNNKRVFTLVEVLFSSVIGIIALYMLTTVIMQIYDIFRETTTENKMGQYSDIIQKKILKKFQLTEASADSIATTSSDNLSYGIVSRDTEWPDTSNIETINLNYSSELQNIIVTGDNIEKQELASDEIKITRCSFEWLKSDPKDLSSVPIVNVQVEYNISIGDKSYYRQEKFSTILKNKEL